MLHEGKWFYLGSEIPHSLDLFCTRANSEQKIRSERKQYNWNIPAKMYRYDEGIYICWDTRKINANLWYFFRIYEFLIYLCILIWRFINFNFQTIKNLKLKYLTVLILTYKSEQKIFFRSNLIASLGKVSVVTGREFD